MKNSIQTKSVQIFKLGDNLQVTQEARQHPLEHVFEVEHICTGIDKTAKETVFVQFEPSRAIAYSKLLSYYLSLKNESVTSIITY